MGRVHNSSSFVGCEVSGRAQPKTGAHSALLRRGYDAWNVAEVPGRGEFILPGSSISSAASGRSADFQSAVSPTCSRQGVRRCGALSNVKRPADCKSAIQRDTAECNSALLALRPCRNQGEMRTTLPPRPSSRRQIWRGARSFCPSSRDRAGTSAARASPCSRARARL